MVCHDGKHLVLFQSSRIAGARQDVHSYGGTIGNLYRFPYRRAILLHTVVTYWVRELRAEASITVP